MSITAKEKTNWSVYIIEVDDGSLYTGISTDPERRFQEHLTGKKGAKFFRGRTPIKIVFLETGYDRSLATKREMEIKKLPRKDKLLLVDSI